MPDPYVLVLALLLLGVAVAAYLLLGPRRRRRGGLVELDRPRARRAIAVRGGRQRDDRGPAPTVAPPKPQLPQPFAGGVERGPAFGWNQADRWLEHQLRLLLGRVDEVERELREASPTAPHVAIAEDVPELRVSFDALDRAAGYYRRALKHVLEECANDKPRVDHIRQAAADGIRAADHELELAVRGDAA